MSEPDSTTGMTDATNATRETAAEPGDDRKGDGFWDFGVVTTLVVVGLALIVFPEPATSIFGGLFLAIGVSLWVLDMVA